MTLKTMTNRLYRPLLSQENTLFFSILFARGDLPSSELRYMFFIFFCFLFMLLVCYEYLDGSDFLLLFFELFS